MNRHLILILLALALLWAVHYVWYGNSPMAWEPERNATIKESSYE